MIEQTIYNMLTENTGTHMLDSGGGSGRHWQRNQKKSIEDFKKEPEATLSFDVSGDWIYLDPTVSVFHKLTKVLEENELCKEFNAMKVNKWDSEKYYGLSKEGENFYCKMVLLLMIIRKAGFGIPTTLKIVLVRACRDAT